MKETKQSKKNIYFFTTYILNKDLHIQELNDNLIYDRRDKEVI